LCSISALILDLGDVLRFSYPADQALASEFKAESVGLARRIDGSGASFQAMPLHGGGGF